MWRGCADARPWLLVRPDADRWLCFAISGQDYDSAPFELRDDHPNFPATGLKKTSFIYDAESFHQLRVTAFTKRLGQLEGTMLSDFRKSAGV